MILTKLLPHWHVCSLRELELEASGFGHQDITSQLQGHSAQVSAAYYSTSNDRLLKIPASKVEQSRILGRLFHRKFKLDVVGCDIYQYNFNKMSILRPPPTTSTTVNSSSSTNHVDNC